MSGVAPLPKPNSGAFKDELDRVLKVLDIPRAIVVIEGALDRNALEGIVKKALQGKAVRAGAYARHDLVAAVAQTFCTREKTAYPTMRALDKAAHKERSIVASIEEDALKQRLNEYKALDFRRERARLVWALLRDGRAAHEEQAGRLLTETIQTVGQSLEEQRALEGKESTTDQEALDRIKARIETYENQLKEQHEVIAKEQHEKRKIEDERSALLARIGQKERALKIETARRKEAEAETKKLRAEVHALHEQLEQASREDLRTTAEERDRLKKKAETLERKLEHAEKLSVLREENADLEAELDELRRAHDKQREENRSLLRQIASRDRATQERVQELRASLKTARKLATGAPLDQSQAGGEPVIERVGLFVDATNISASARREHGGNFDFIAATEALLEDRKAVARRVYLVENDKEGGDGFRGFVRMLESAGLEVRHKRPKTMPDGSQKADWDMAIAMEILDLRNQVDTIVLFSGDGDYLPLVRRLKQWNKRVEVAAYSASTDKALSRTADRFVPLDGRFVVR